MIQAYLTAFKIGVIAGMRAMAAPALLSRKLARTMPAKEPNSPLQYFSQPPIAIGLSVLAAGEMIADKLPNAPNRIVPPQFIGRIASGATCGAIASDVEGKAAPLGALAGGLGAIVGTVAFYNFRRLLDHELGLPDAVGALAEDALVIGVGWTVVNDLQVTPQPSQQRVVR